MDIKEQDLLGGAVSQHWYYKSKAAALSRCLEGRPFSRVLDVGAGAGFFSRHLLATTGAQEALCVDPHYDREWDDRVLDKPLRFRQATDDYAADLVLLMDVLEHVDDDVALLHQYTHGLASGASVMITVPAFPFLWSLHDDFLEHRRRYTIATLCPVVEQAGLKVLNVSYGFALVFPLVAAVRLAARLGGAASQPASDLKVHHPWVNGALATLCALERPFMRHNKLMGLSVFCLAEKS